MQMEAHAQAPVGKGDTPLVTLRLARCKDADALANLKTALSLEAEHMVFDVADRADLVGRCEAELASANSGKRQIFVVEINGALIGFIDIHRIPGEHADFLASFDLAVRREVQGYGLGARLVCAAEDWARGIGIPYLVIVVATANARAAALYTRLGYIIYPTPSLVSQHVLTKVLVKGHAGNIFPILLK